MYVLKNKYYYDTLYMKGVFIIITILTSSLSFQGDTELQIENAASIYSCLQMNLLSLSKAHDLKY